ncbi:MAG: ribonuclease P protein component [Ignavibacteriae bacterium]|nr:ribonuclease P protein component [Ignavibacteriota bacterium]
MKKYSLSKVERLRQKKDFQKVYLNGKLLNSAQNKLKVNYYFESSVNESGIKAAFVVSKKNGNAVWRNRFKRILRAAYRISKLEVVEFCVVNNFLLYLIFSPKTINQKQNKKLSQSFLIDDVIDLLQKVKLKLEKHA